MEWRRSRSVWVFFLHVLLSICSFLWIKIEWGGTISCLKEKRVFLIILRYICVIQTCVLQFPHDQPPWAFNQFFYSHVLPSAAAFIKRKIHGEHCGHDQSLIDRLNVRFEFHPEVVGICEKFFEEAAPLLGDGGDGSIVGSGAHLKIYVPEWAETSVDFAFYREQRVVLKRSSFWTLKSEKWAIFKRIFNYCQQKCSRP